MTADARERVHARAQMERSASGRAGERRAVEANALAHLRIRPLAAMDATEARPQAAADGMQARADYGVAKCLVGYFHRSGYVIVKRPPIGGGAVLGRRFEGLSSGYAQLLPVFHGSVFGRDSFVSKRAISMR
jgi:hypothetical protein